VRLPLSWFLAIKLAHGAAGCWVAMAVTTSVLGVWTILLYRNGGWKLKRV